MTTSSTAIVPERCKLCYKHIDLQPICEQEQAQILKCQHIFHRKCIEPWSEQTKTCPACHPMVLYVATADQMLAETDRLAKIPLPPLPDFLIAQNQNRSGTYRRLSGSS